MCIKLVGHKTKPGLPRPVARKALYRLLFCYIKEGSSKNSDTTKYRGHFNISIFFRHESAISKQACMALVAPSVLRAINILYDMSVSVVHLSIYFIGSRSY